MTTFIEDLLISSVNTNTVSYYQIIINLKKALNNTALSKYD